MTESFCGSSLAVLGQVSLVMNHALDQSGAAILVGAQHCLLPSSFHLLPRASAATGWLPSKDVTVPYKTEPQRSGFYLVLSNDKSLPHSTASAAGTCWRPSVKGIVYVVGDPELITIPPSPIHYCSSC